MIFLPLQLCSRQAGRGELEVPCIPCGAPEGEEEPRPPRRPTAPPEVEGVASLLVRYEQGVREGCHGNVQQFFTDEIPGTAHTLTLCYRAGEAWTEDLQDFPAVMISQHSSMTLRKRLASGSFVRAQFEHKGGYCTDNWRGIKCAVL